MGILIVLITYCTYVSFAFIYREFLGLLKTADGDKIVEDPIIESFYKVVIYKGSQIMLMTLGITKVINESSSNVYSVVVIYQIVKEVNQTT